MTTDDHVALSLTVEDRALLLDRTAIIRIVSALRGYRQAARALLAKLYVDGEVDAVALCQFSTAIENSEADLIEEPQ